MKLSNYYVLIERIEEPEKQGDFETVQVQDSFVYKGRIKELPEIPVYMGNDRVSIGDVIIFKKGSPDTFEYNKDKFVKIEDLIAVV